MSDVKIIQFVLKLKVFSAILLFTCLLFLTCSNFLIYSICNTVKVELVSNLNDEEKVPAAPEEKSANNSISIQEEYVHEYDYAQNNLAFNHRTHHIILEILKLKKVHFELVSPPPDHKA